MSAVSIRPARPGDAAGLARLGNELARLMGTGEVYTTEGFKRYAFGPKPHFEAVVAEAASKVVGYALFEEAFNTDICEPGMWLHDILVEEDMRSSRIGEDLMAAVARLALDRGRTSLWCGI